MKQVKKRNGGRRTGLRIGILLAATLVVGGGMALWRGLAPSGSSPQTEAATLPPAPSAPPADRAIDLGDGLVLTDILSAAGPFPEDGTDTVLPNVLCIKVENNNSATLRVARVSLKLNGAEYLFELTNLPPGESLHAYEKNRAAAPAAVNGSEAECLYAVFWDTEPTVGGGQLDLTVADRGITVRNVSGEDLETDVFIYYKTRRDGVYVGGITYRVTVSGGLRAGDEVTVYAAHATADYTEIMFVEYGKE